MTAKKIQKRNVKSNQLKVIQTETGQIFVESYSGFTSKKGDESFPCHQN